MTMSAPRVPTSSLISAVLPSPMKVRGSGLGRFCSTVPRQVPPAVSNRAASSSRVSSVAFSSLVRLGALSPTRMARLISFTCVSSNIETPLTFVLLGPCPRQSFPAPRRGNQLKSRFSRGHAHREKHFSAHKCEACPSFGQALRAVGCNTPPLNGHMVSVQWCLTRASTISPMYMVW